MKIPESLLKGHAPDILEDIFEICCKENRVSPSFARSKTRKRECVTSRQMYMTVLKEFTTYSLQSIGVSVGLGKDHATVLYANRTVSNLCQTSRIYRDSYNRIRQKVYELIQSKRGEITDHENVENAISKDTLAKLISMNELVRDDILMEGWRKTKVTELLSNIRQNVLILNQ